MVREAGRALGEVLAGVRELLQPAASIVLGGDIGEAHEQLLAGIREVVFQRSLPLATRDLRIVTSQLGDRAGVDRARRSWSSSTSSRRRRSIGRCRGARPQWRRRGGRPGTVCAMPELELTRSRDDRKLYVLNGVGTLRLQGWLSRTATAEADSRSWELARRGVFTSVFEATDASGTTVGEFRGRTLRRGGTLQWGTRELELRPASAWRSRFALADGERELAIFDGKGWASARSRSSSTTSVPSTPAWCSSPRSWSAGWPRTRPRRRVARRLRRPARR